MTPEALEILERMARRAQSPPSKSVLLIAIELRRAWREAAVQRQRGNLLKAVAEIYKEELDERDGKARRNRTRHVSRA